MEVVIMEKYEKPRMIFNDIRLNSGIAATCWGLAPGHPHDKEYFYDVEGEGYVGFHVQSASGHCGGPDAYEIKYYEYLGDEGDPVKGATYEKILEEELTKKGGNNGQPYNNLSVDFPENPNPSWS